MNRKNILVLVLPMLLVVVSSCSKWLNVQPEDRYTQDQVYSTAEGYEEALNGVYLMLSSNDLYGDNLTLTVPDVMAQLYKTNLDSGHPFFSLGSYDYSNQSVKSRFKAVWKTAYSTIMNINNLLAQLDKNGNEVLGANRLKLIKGELLGLRAYMHFDVLRLFGPVYNSNDSIVNAIPYYNIVQAEVQPLLPANQVLDYAVNDVEAALQLLEADPVRSLGYKDANNQRFNYFAAMASKARMLLWRKDTVGALQAAKIVVDEATAVFPWIVAEKITADLQNPDRIFYTELLFSVYANNLYTNYNNYFYYGLGNRILAGGSNQFINKVFESKTADYRNTFIWRPAPQGVSYVAFNKYADIANLVAGAEPQRNIIPLIRLSEMYYILAETVSDPTVAIDYLNRVLNARGISKLANTVNVQTEVMKEYRKEFYGEGQLWYYYKRRKIASILSALPSNNNGTIPAAAWVVPIPEEELANR